MGHYQEYQVLVRKTDFPFGGVHVNVELHVRHVQEQDRHRLAVDTVGLISLADSLGDGLVLDGPVPQV